RRPQGGGTGTWHTGRFRLARGPGAGQRNGDRFGFCNQLLAGSSIRERTSGLVLPSARRIHQVRGKSAQKVRGCLSAEFLQFGLEESLGRNEGYHSLLATSRSSHLPRRQSPYET